MQKYFKDPVSCVNNYALPFVYQIESTEMCNLQCPACLNPEMKAREHLRMEVLDALLNQDALACTPYTELQFSGEPTLNPALGHIIASLQPTGVLLSLSTNLTNVNIETMALFNMLDSVTLSVDTVDPAAYERSRKPHKFEAMWDNLFYFLGHVEPNVLVNLQLLLTEWTKGTMKHSETVLMGIARGLNKHNVVVRYVDDCFLEQRTERQLYGSLQAERGMCINPFTAVSIKTDGAVVPCCFDFKSELAFGNVLDQELEQIWKESKDLNQLRSAHRLGDEDGLPQKCRDCYYRSPIKLVYSLLTDLIQFRKRHHRVTE